MKNIWKIFKIILIVIVSLLVLAIIGAFIFLKTFDIKKYKPQIISAAEKALGRQVNFDDIDLQASLKEGIRLNLKNFKVSENPQFGTADFVEVGQIAVGVDVLSFVNARQISIPNILVKSPRINVIRNSAGKMNVETIGTQPSAAPAPDASASSTPAPVAGTAPAPAPSSGGSSAAALPAIFINSLRIENAQLNYIDQSVTPPVEASVSQLNIGVDHFSLVSPFNFYVEAAILASKQNFKVEGNAQLNLRNNEVHLSNIRLNTDLGLLNLEEVRRLPYVKGQPVPETLEGLLSVSLKELTASSQGVGALVVDTTKLSNGKVVIAQVAPGIALDLHSIELAVMEFSMDHPFNVSLQAAYLNDTPNIDFKGMVGFDAKTGSATVKNAVFATDFSRWPLEKIKSSLAPLKDAPLPEELAGTFQASIKDLAVSSKGLDRVLMDILWQNGGLVMTKAVPGVSLTLNKTNFALKDFALNNPFQISLQTAYLSDTPNISVDGMADFNMKTQAVRLKDMKLALDLDSLAIKDLKSTVTALKDAPLPEVLGGKLAVLLKNVSAGPKGLESILADVNLSQGKLLMKDAAPGVSINANAIDVSVLNFSLAEPFQVKTKLRLLSDEPNIAFGGTVAYNMQTQDVELKDSALSVDLDKLNLAELKSSMASLKDVPLPEKLAGNLNAKIHKLAAGPKGVGSVLLDFDWKDGAVSMKDVSPGVSVAASKIDLGLKSVSLSGEPFKFTLKAAYLNDEPNIDLAGAVAVNQAAPSVQLTNTVFKTDLSTYAMDQLRASVASLKDVPLPQSLKGLLNLSVEEATAGAKGLVSLKSKGDLTGGSIRMKELAVPIDNVDLKFQADQLNAIVDGLSLTLGKAGSVKAKASVADYLTKQNFNAELAVKDIDLAEIVDQQKAPVKMEGLINANLKAQGQASDLNTIVGDGQVDVKDAKLKDLNVLKLVLDKIAVIPNLAEKVKGALSEKYIKKLEDKDTQINKVAATVSVASGLINVTPIDIEADEFLFNGQCQADFKQKYELSGAFKIPEELSASMIKGAAELQYLQDLDGNISFPLRVSGQGSAVPSFTPDVGSLMKNAVMNKGKEELGRVLRKALGGGDAPPTSEPGSQGTGGGTGSSTGGSTQERTKSPEEAIIDGVFGTIFK